MALRGLRRHLLLAMFTVLSTGCATPSNCGQGSSTRWMCADSAKSEADFEDVMQRSAKQREQEAQQREVEANAVTKGKLYVSKMPTDGTMFDGGCYDPNHNIAITQKLDEYTYEIVIPDCGPIMQASSGVTCHGLLKSKIKFSSIGYVRVKMKRTGKVMVTGADGFEQRIDTWETCSDLDNKTAVHGITGRRATERVGASDFNSCTDNCYTDHSGDKAAANGCYDICRKKFPQN